MKITKKTSIVISIPSAILVIFVILGSSYDSNSSYTQIDDFENSSEIKKIRGIPEVEEFLAKHVDANILGVSTDSTSITLYASGGYSGEYLKIHHPFDESSGMILGCTTDYGAKKEFSSEILEHIKNNSCEDI